MKNITSSTHFTQVGTLQNATHPDPDLDLDPDPDPDLDGSSQLTVRKTVKTVAKIERFLQQLVTSMPTDLEQLERNGPGRPRVLPSMCLWTGMLVCVARGFSSQLDLWRLLSSGDLWLYPRFPISDQAVYKRLEQEGTAPLQHLFEGVSKLLAQRLAPLQDKTLAPFAKAVLALDESTLDKIARLLPALRGAPKGSKLLLPGKLAALFNLRIQQWRHIQHIDNPDQNCKVAARSMLQDVEEESLVLIDLGYFSFELFDWLTTRKIWWVSRLRVGTSYELIHRFYDRCDEAGKVEVFDGLVWLGAYRADRAGHAARLVQFMAGNTQYQYITNVLDPGKLPIEEIARLYARRWDIELAFKLVKRHLGLAMLWSAKSVVIQQQVWAVLIISQILQGLRMEVAGRAGAEVYDVSMELMVRYMPQYAYMGHDPVQAFVERGREMRFIRPSTRTYTQIQAPTIDPEQMTPVPTEPELVLVREARYAHRKCGPRPVLRN